MLKRFKRPLDSYNQTWLGFVGVILIAAMLGAVLLVGKLNLGTRSYQGEFAQSAQLGKGNMVTIAGIQVGTVDSVKLAGDHVQIGFNVRKDVHLGADTQASIKMTTILGSRYLALYPAGAGDLDHRTIRLANTEVPFDLQETLASATSTFGAVDADRIVSSVKTMTDTLQGLPEALPAALTNLESLAGVIASRRGQLGTLLNNADTLTTMLRNQRADLGALVLQGRDLLSEIATRRAQVERLFASATTLVDRAQTIMADEPALDKLLSDTEEFAKLMSDNDALLRSILQAMPITVRNLANATGSGNSIDVNLPAGILVDSWMCAISGRARQFNLVEYFKDCE
ncbi:MlaD family protein [Mycobacterium sp.]|uniref:MlaD family protein n=1 Tax=Mycobacterium sp. TaxID=1785 RepID=UPI003A84D1C4